MSAYRCDQCGKFCNRLHDVWASMPQLGIDREVCNSCLPINDPRRMSAPLPQRLRAAADAVIELNAMEGFHAPERAGVSAKYLLEAADRMEADE